MATKTQVEILDSSLNLICVIKSLVPFGSDKGTKRSSLDSEILQYSKELSDFGSCRFRVDAYDPNLVTYGDILVPHKNHVRIRRDNYIVWQGAIISNTKRTRYYIEVLAVEYEYYFNKKLVHRTTADVNGTANIYRTFDSGTMSDAVTAIINETINDYKGSHHCLANMTIGTIENPDYPPNMTSSSDNKALTGAWSFGKETTDSRGPTLQYDFHTIMYILQSFGIYSYSDFQITYDLKFNFKKFLGNKLQSNLVFQFGQQGNIFDYNLPRLGKRQVNKLTCIATDPNGVILHSDQSNQSSIDADGELEGAEAFSDVKSQAVLDARAQAEIPLISTADETNAVIYLNENAYPLGQYDIGDIVTIKVKNRGVDFNEIRRIVGITVTLDDTGREEIIVQTNIPMSWQYS